MERSALLENVLEADQRIRKLIFSQFKENEQFKKMEPCNAYTDAVEKIYKIETDKSVCICHLLAD